MEGVEGCVPNMFADDVIIYTLATSNGELKYRLKVGIDNISNWYSMTKLCIDKKKFNAMVIGRKCQLKYLNLDGVFNIQMYGGLAPYYMYGCMYSETCL